MAYYLGLTPDSFWNGTYREIYLFCEMGLLRMQEDFKQDIVLNDAATNKLIEGHPMNEKAKVTSLTKIFSGLFSKK